MFDVNDTNTKVCYLVNTGRDVTILLRNLNERLQDKVYRPQGANQKVIYTYDKRDIWLRLPDFIHENLVVLGVPTQSVSPYNGSKNAALL